MVEIQESKDRSPMVQDQASHADLDEIASEFPPEEWEELHSEDKKAATVIDILLLGIFAFGVCSALVTCFSVMSR